MLPVLILLIISTTLAENCDYVYNGQPYTKSTLLNITGLPANLVYNPNNKDLLFTLIDIKTLQKDDEQTKMDQYILRKGETIKIDNINGQSAAVDLKNNIVYIASDAGLHVLNETNKANHIGLRDKDVVQISKPNNGEELYAVLFPHNEVVKINVKNNDVTNVRYVPCAFILAVDDSDNIFYECDSKYVKVLLKGFEEPIEFVGLPKNSGKAFNVDSKGNVILAASDGLYQLRPDNIIPKKLMDLDFVPAGVAFDDDDIYLSTYNVIYKYSKCN